MSNGKPALSGLKVLEVAQVIAGPMAGTLLADLGAEVVHVEDPAQGDPQRKTGIANDDGIYLWWKVSGRNKRSVTIDLRTAHGQALVRKLAAWADVYITNFRVGTLEKWGLDWRSMHAVNPKLIMLQISGFGTNTTLRNSPGFGKVGEAMSGVVNITGFPDGPPLHTGFSHADSVTGLMGAFAVQAALYRRAQDPDFDGEWIDLALFESLYRLIEWQVIVQDQIGVVPERAGNQLPVSPAAVINTYLSSDDRWITVTSGTSRSVQKVAALLGLPAEEFATVEQQNNRRLELDSLLGEWIRARPAEEALAAMRAAEVVASPVYTVNDILEDQTYREREDIITVPDQELGDVRMQAVVPKMANHGGRVWRTGPALGQDNDLVFTEYLGLDADEYTGLKKRGVI
ncbi:MAG TPA: CoA transferase [Amycolatopsis sp.]|nr:CoA transferase [Amycolatopsis sp.]